MMKENIKYDSLEHGRNVNVQFYILGPKRNLLDKIELDFDRIIIWNDSLEKLDMYLTNEYSVKLMGEFLNKCNEYKNNTNISLMVVICPDKKKNAEIICNTYDNIIELSRYTTKSGINLYSVFLDNKSKIKYDGKIYLNINYRDLIKEDIILDDKEIQFIHDSIYKQSQETWFDDLKSLDDEFDSDSIPLKRQMNIRVDGYSDHGPRVTSYTSSTSENFVENPSSLKVHNGFDDPEKELDKIIGMENIKTSVKKLKYKLEYREERKQRGINDDSTSNLHMVFMGNPGTGKTTIARVMAGILYNMGYIQENKCIEVNGLDLKGAYVGQTAIITNQIINEAKGGILFIDEAYALCQNRGGDYGKEAVSILLKEMEDNRNKLIVIFAGYENDINDFLDINPGFRSRINKYFKFEDYTTIELAQMMLKFFHDKHLYINGNSMYKAIKLFKEAKKAPNFSNGRFVRNFCDQVEEQHILNTSGIRDYNRLDTVIEEDISNNIMQSLLKNGC